MYIRHIKFGACYTVLLLAVIMYLCTYIHTYLVLRVLHTMQVDLFIWVSSRPWYSMYVLHCNTLWGLTSNTILLHCQYQFDL